MMDVKPQGDEEGLILYHSFDDGTATDSTANNNDGVLYNHTDEILDDTFFTPDELPLSEIYVTDNNWVMQNRISYDTNGNAAQAAAVYSGNQTYMQRKID